MCGGSVSLASGDSGLEEGIIYIVTVSEHRTDMGCRPSLKRLNRSCLERTAKQEKA